MLEKRTLQRNLRLLVWLMISTIIVTISLAWIFFPEEYLFFQYFISRLGRIETHSNLSNLTSMIIFITGFSLVATLSLIISVLYYTHPTLEFNFLKGSLTVLLAIGAVGIAIPADHPTLATLHNIGAFFFIFTFGIYNFVAQLLLCVIKHDSKVENQSIDFYIDLVIAIIVFVVFLLYTIIAILDMMADIIIPWLTTELTQKIVLIVDCVSVFFLDIPDM
ncbi:MAG: hypothetical protein U9O98_07565 [Asgard group archaeon]|nr:hypothetical protein [Asgard group archaeon]